MMIPFEKLCEALTAHRRRKELDGDAEPDTARENARHPHTTPPMPFSPVSEESTGELDVSQEDIVEE